MILVPPERSPGCANKASRTVASEKPAETRVYVTGTMDCRPEEATNGTYQQIPEDLLSIFKKMESPPSQVHGDNDTHPTKDQ